MLFINILVVVYIGPYSNDVYTERGEGVTQMQTQ